MMTGLFVFLGELPPTSILYSTLLYRIVFFF